MLSFFPRDVLDEIWDLIGSVSGGFPSDFSFSYKRRYFKQNKNTFKYISDGAQYIVCNISVVKKYMFFVKLYFN